MIIKYNKFLLENNNIKHLNYHMYDWDDNILVMPTYINVDKLINNEWVPVKVSTSEFADIRGFISDYNDGKESIWRYRNNSPSESFSEFRDWGERGENAFIEDSLKAIKTNSFGPVWNNFIDCLIGGHIFMIITARGHEPDTMKKVIEWIISNYLNKDDKSIMENNLRQFNLLFGVKDFTWGFNKLIDHYLNLCDFIGVNSSYFMDKFNASGEAVNVEKFKTMAIEYFVEKVNNYGKIINRSIKVGFSDDDTKTVQHVYKYLKDKLWYQFPIDYYVFHTKDGVKKLEEKITSI